MKNEDKWPFMSRKSVLVRMWVMRVCCVICMANYIYKLAAGHELLTTNTVALAGIYCGALSLLFEKVAEQLNEDSEEI